VGEIFNLGRERWRVADDIVFKKDREVYEFSRPVYLLKKMVGVGESHLSGQHATVDRYGLTCHATRFFRT